MPCSRASESTAFLEPGGIGAALISAARERASSMGYERMTLLTFANVPWNAPYYRRLGFDDLHDPGPDLQQFREHEVALGLDAYGERVAMFCDLSSTAS